MTIPQLAVGNLRNSCPNEYRNFGIRAGAKISVIKTIRNPKPETQNSKLETRDARPETTQLRASAQITMNYAL